jgi:hypothetical protein
MAPQTLVFFARYFASALEHAGDFLARADDRLAPSS